MPIYEYQCRACGHKLEALQKISDDPLLECPHCNAKSLKKLISAAAFRLKGGGWYETDFKKGEKKNLASQDGGKPVKNIKKKADGGGSGSTKSGSSWFAGPNLQYSGRVSTVSPAFITCKRGGRSVVFALLYYAIAV